MLHFDMVGRAVTGVGFCPRGAGGRVVRDEVGVSLLRDVAHTIGDMAISGMNSAARMKDALCADLRPGIWATDGQSGLAPA